MARPTPTNSAPVDFGPNVLIFDPSMPMADITSKIAPIYWSQNQASSEFGSGRYAYLFKPGSYNLSVDVGYYQTVHGLGLSPDDVTITGAVQSLATRTQGLALNNFWRGVEGLCIEPQNPDIVGWAISQATFLRRVHVKGRLFLWDYRFDNQGGNFSSGGFIADSAIDGQTISGTQQQFMIRNTSLGGWDGGVWNMVFVGDQNPPNGTWPDQPFTVIGKTPVLREKPYLIVDNNDNYSVQRPGLKFDSQGASTASDPVTTLDISSFYIAKAGTDTADSLNNALDSGSNLILTPGIYHLDETLHVTHEGTVILGIGMATLIPETGLSAMTIDDVNGVSVSGIIIDAGLSQRAPLLIVGPNGSSANHAANPTALFDVSCRVGGALAGSTQNCVTINSNNVIMDNIWIWRADHGKPGTVGWDINPSENGLTVNGNDVIAYGLFVEHFQGFQTIWNGNGGQVYFYQSEIPYDPPDQASWRQINGEKGFPSYKLSDQVTSHTAAGLGVYCNFHNKVQLENAIATPVAPAIQLRNMVTIWLNGVVGSSINHIINGRGAAVPNQKATLNS